ncbi:MAG TPA: nicotinate-nucleotide adenylyltransferase [Methylomirabilota bacterium]|nr:nicotinate-nucleotide adenylyltransferase [Methylomirabilota bacterium]
MFGGSFNPVHLGHLLVADEIAEILDLERVLFVPAASPPHKPEAELAPARHRYEMTRLAVAEHPRFEVSDVELRRSGPSYTVDTLEVLSPRGDLHLLIGSETFLDLLSWREPRRVAGLARLVVVPRTGGGFDPDSAPAQKVLRELGLGRFVSPSAGAQTSYPLASPPAAARQTPPLSPDPRTPVLVAAASLPISGSDLRKRAREGRSLAFRMPASVAAYIREHGLYRSGA